MIRPEIVHQVLNDREAARATTVKESPPPPPPPVPDNFLNVQLGSDFFEPAPTRGHSLAFFVIGLLVLPLLLVVMESNPRLGALEAIRGPLGEALISRVTGYNIEMPPLPDSLPPALQPPKVPVPLPDTETRPLLPTALPSETETKSSEPVFAGKTMKAKSVSPTVANQTAINRVIFAHRGDTLYGLARKYYEKPNGTLVGRVKSHNPQIPDAGTILQENQPVVLPYLAPDFPWRLASSSNERH